MVGKTKTASSPVAKRAKSPATPRNRSGKAGNAPASQDETDAIYDKSTGLTPELHATIVDEMGVSGFWKYAAERVGMGNSTIRKWRGQGEDDLEAGTDTDMARLVAACARAKRGAVRHRWKLHGEVRAKGGGPDAKALEWELGVLDPAVFGAKQSIDVTSGGEPVISMPQSAIDDALIEGGRCAAERKARREGEGDES